MVSKVFLNLETEERPCLVSKDLTKQKFSKLPTIFGKKVSERFHSSLIDSSLLELLDSSQLGNSGEED